MKTHFFFGRAAALLLVAVGFSHACVGSLSADESPASAEGPSVAETPVSFSKQIEPIFRQHCYGCHQGAKQLGAYVMTDFTSLVRGGETGEPAIVPGHPEQSYLIDQITPVDGVAEMPKSPAKPLGEVEVELVRRWIAEGAKNDSTSGPATPYSADNPPRYNEAPAVPSIDVSPDGSQIAIAGLHEVLLIDADSGVIDRRLIGISPRINSVRYSPDGSRLAATGGTPGVRGEVQIWNPASGELELSAPFTYDALSGAGWSPDGSKLAFGASDNVVRAIDAGTGTQLLFQGAHEDWIRDVAFTPDGTHLVSVARDMSCKLTEVETERFIDNITSITPGALSGGLSSIAMHPSRNEILIGGADGVAKVYRIFRETARKIGDDANLIRTLPAMKGRIFNVAINDDASRIAAVATLDGKSEVRVWAYDFTGTLTDELKKILAKRVADRSADEKKKADAYRKTETKELAAYHIDDAAAYAIAFAPDNSLLIAASNGTLQRLAEDGTVADAIDWYRATENAEAGDEQRIAARYDAGAWIGTLETASKDKVDPKSIQSIQVSPQSAEFQSPYAYVQLVVTATTTDGDTIDVTRACNIETPEFITAGAAGLLCGTQNGGGEVVVSLGEHRDSVKVVANNISQGSDGAIGAVDFIRDVNPVLSRLGCNQGTCHGAQKGKNGFKLSLRGYDPIFDLRALTDDLAARRINAAAPEESLMLRKPLGQTPHQGGVLMSQGDPYHAILRRWIADGSQLELNTPRVTKLEVYPQNPVIQSIGTEQQVRLVAHYADGRIRDVTREAFIESGNTEVATAGKGGLLKAVRRGEAAILARYEGNYVATTLTVMGNREDYQEQDYETWGKIDELVAAKWRRVKVQPSELADDAAFLRRVTLDLTGLPPTSEQVRDFLADDTPTQQKRAQVIDQLLGSEGYVDYWTNKWADLLQVNRKFLGVEGSKAFRDWIRTAVVENRPYDQFARQILTATGSNKDNPAASYFKVLRDPENTMENTTHLFLGIRFNCNKCHDHPFERWTQDQYYELAAYFGQVDLQNDPASGGKKIGGTAVEGAKPLYEKVVDKQDGEVIHGRTGDVAPPSFPYQVPCDVPEQGTRREKLATWMTDADNPYFARSFVNRLWGYLLGVGLIEPIDDIRAGNPPTNPELLNHLTEQFVESGFDVRAMLRQICNSRTYQLSVATNPLNEDDTLNYARAIPRRLPAEVIYDAVHALTGAESNIPGMPKGTRAAAVTDSGVKLNDGFLQNLGRPVRESACECERSSELQLGPIMALIGGPTVATAIADPKNELERIVQENPDDRELATEIFLRSIGRPPTEIELAAFDQIKQQIKIDHELLEKELAAKETEWAERKQELEQIRETKLAETNAQLAARIEAAKPEQERLANERQARIEKATKALEAVNQKLAEKVKQWESDHAAAVEWHPLRPSKASSTNKAKLVAAADRSITASGKAGKAVYTVHFPTSLKNITGFRLEALSDPSLPSNGPGLPPNGNFVITELEIKVASDADPKTFSDVTIASGKADYLQQGFTIEATFDGNKRDQGGWAVAGATGADHWATFKLKQPLENPDGCVLQFQIHQFHNAADHQLGRFRISATTDGGDIPLDLPETLRSIVSTPDADRDEAAKKTLIDYIGKTDPERAKAEAALAEAKKAVPRDAETVRLEKRRDALMVPTPDDARIVRLRSDVAQSKQQVERLRLTAAEDLTWALINSPAFLFNH
ncbi:WD domain, G-beta repeat [Stieleria maiorica]|uniref:WD domain, G-beta repeat n=1 Tax=Stieleria maiorica TaxID=2795974 RepID=A0A5B9ML25_9BACT|nr:DUF1549 domain-containing protein [Stieleria maiorica]QEG01634.1 WD domain, G-beta repeat [Stieleria maiorica]